MQQQPTDRMNAGQGDSACRERGQALPSMRTLPLHALEVDHLAIRFGTTEIFRDLSFKVPLGSSLVLIGPNGGGKTVLFRALIGSLAYEGSIRWAPGTKLGYVPQKLDIERALPVTGNDLLHAKAAITKTPTMTLLAALDRVGLESNALNVPIGALSGGQFQEVLLAFALIGDPNVLLLDEPTAGVDAPSRDRLYRLIQKLQDESGLTAILISHDLSVVARSATNVLCLSRANSCFGPPKTILDPELLSRMYGMPVGFHVHDIH
jgi:zinc transport system ATP-binding protein